MLELEIFKNAKCDKYVDPVLQQLCMLNIVPRIWDYDHTVWKPDPKEISNRLGWLHIVDEMSNQQPEILAFVDEVKQENYTHVVLLGMGGSSLASDVFRRVFSRQEGFLELSILDSTDPDAVQQCLINHDLCTTLFIVATKSGGTAETLSFFKYFYNMYLEMMESAEAGHHFIAITDPGSKLASLAENLTFRRTFLNNPHIGGRFSVLSYFGLVPAALMGVDIQKLLASAKRMMVRCGPTATDDENPAVKIGGMLGALALKGIDKATFMSSPAIAPFGDWVEQLIAESTGKEGKGILPVVDEPVGNIEEYGTDRIFIVHHLSHETVCDEIVNILNRNNFPVIHITIDDVYDFGALFFLWEMATSIAGHCLGIQPFDQPNVELAKLLARESINRYMETGELEPVSYAVLGREQLDKFLSVVKFGNYAAIQAYVPSSSAVDTVLTELQLYIRNRYRIPVTKGYGPRFLHSTGQLHKGDSGHGLFIQLVSDSVSSVPIPDNPGQPESSMSFNILKTAQALGDYKALCDVNRKVIRFKLSRDIVGEIRKLMS